MSLSMQLKVLLTGPPCPRKSDTLLRFNICSRKPRLGPYQPETAACIEVKTVGLHRGEKQSETVKTVLYNIEKENGWYRIFSAFW